MSFVEGSYETPNEAIDAVRALEAKGYHAKDLRLVSNEGIRDTFMDQTDAKFTAREDYREADRSKTDEEDESVWEKVKDFFSIDEDYDYDREGRPREDDPLVEYRKDIEAGRIILLVEGEPIQQEETIIYYEEDDILNQPINDPIEPVDRTDDLGDHNLDL